MDSLEMNIDRSALHENECMMKKRELHTIKEIEKWLNESNMQTQDGMVNEDAERARVDKAVSDIENAAVKPSYENDILTEVNREAQQANAFLTKELKRHKEKQKKHFSNETTNESEYCKKIKLLNKEISNLKSQACQKEKSFHKENEKYDDLGFKNQNDVENPFIMNKAKELIPSLYNIDEIRKDLPSNHKVISEEELKCEAEKYLKVKQRKSPLLSHGFV
nr:hypothetical protein [Tanacetum cinerariifolium]